ncbi:MAG: 3-phosphoglycerate dehydrogenase [Polaribacter sp.]|nr:MAG: 3-phosphoglycerate dehydrogenase [Polaribacter sp.]
MKILATNLTIDAKKLLKASDIEVIDTEITQNELINFIENQYIEGIIFDKLEDFNSDLIDTCTSIKLIAFKDNIEENSDIQYAKDQGIHIVSVSNATSVAKAELTFAHLLGMVRFLHQSNREMPLEGDINFDVLHNNFMGTEVKDKTIGIIGMNNTGIEIAKIAIGLGMKPLMTDHQPKNVLVPIEFYDGQTIEFHIEYSDFNDVLSKSDFLIINTKSDNSFILDEHHFEQLKNGVGIVNLEQGAINEITLLNAIEHKKVTFAGLDAFEHQPTPEIQLLMNPELSLSPNVGSKTYEAQLKISNELANAIVNILE